MALDDLTMEELNERNIDVAKPKAWRSRVVNALSTIDDAFTKIAEQKTKYIGDTSIETEMDALTAELKIAMFNIYNKY